MLVVYVPVGETPLYLTVRFADDQPSDRHLNISRAWSSCAAGDSPVQSINSCLAMQHLSAYAHAVVLLDNQNLLDQISSKAVSSSSSSSTHGGTGSQVQQRVAGRPPGIAGTQALVSA
jgi:hypothetical protein